MLKKVVFASNLSAGCFTVNFANMIARGLEVFAVWPNINVYSEDTLYVFAYQMEPPQDVVAFLELYGKKRNVHYFFTEEGGAWNTDKKGGLKKRAAFIGKNSEQPTSILLYRAVQELLISSLR